MTPRCLLHRFLRSAPNPSDLSPQEWDLLIRQARHSNLLGRVAARLTAIDQMHLVPRQARAHLEAASMVARRQEQAVRWEVDRIAHALSDVDTPIVLLKGAAYVMAGLPAAAGRMFSDVDILVPKARLDEAEAALKMHGWISTHHDPYDQRYYRDWMHELPPMMNMARQTILDVHHTILPETARLRPDPCKLLQNAVALGPDPNLKILAPVDMVLHSATHLFHEGEFNHGLRDLADLDALLRHFSSADASFWDELVRRGKELDLARPLYYALRYTRSLLATPVPAAVLDAAQSYGPAPLARFYMDALFDEAFAPRHLSCDTWFTRTALWLLFVRSHWLKMPLHLLVPHLLHKAFAQPKNSAA